MWHDKKILVRFDLEDKIISPIFDSVLIILKTCFVLDLLLVLHAILIMVQATTLNVAFNSHNKSLLTIMMSNNVSAEFCFLLLVRKGVHMSTVHETNSLLALILRSFLWRELILQLLKWQRRYFCCYFSLLKLKEVFSRSLKRTISFRCQIVVSS